jgi:hypothetical protein
MYIHPYICIDHLKGILLINKTEQSTVTILTELLILLILPEEAQKAQDG